MPGMAEHDYGWGGRNSDEWRVCTGIVDEMPELHKSLRKENMALGGWGWGCEDVCVNHMTCIQPICTHARPCSCNSPAASLQLREGVVGVVEQVIRMAS